MLVERDPQPVAGSRASRHLTRAGERRAAGHCLEAADVAATAHDRCVIDHLDVAHIPGAALRPAVDAAIRDDPRADAGADLHHHDVLVAHRHAGAPLAERQHIDVVVDPGRHTVAGLEALADRVVVPAGHDRRRDRTAGPVLDRPGHPDPDPEQAAGQIVRRIGQLAEQLLDPGQAALRPGPDVGGLVAVPEHAAVEIGDGDVDARRAEVGDEEVPGVGAERDATRGTAARARTLGLGDEAQRHQLGQRLLDLRPQEAAMFDQLVEERGAVRAQDGADAPRARAERRGSRHLAQPLGGELVARSGADERHPRRLPVCQGGDEILVGPAAKLTGAHRAANLPAGRGVERRHVVQAVSVEHRKHQKVGVDAGRRVERKGECRGRWAGDHALGDYNGATWE